MTYLRPKVICEGAALRSKEFFHRQVCQSNLNAAAFVSEKYVLIFVMFWLKFRMEEKWMRSQFGETYATYARQTAALVPYLL